MAGDSSSKERAEMELDKLKVYLVFLEERLEPLSIIVHSLSPSRILFNILESRVYRWR